MQQPTIQVIPHHKGVNSRGQAVSPFSADAVDIVATGKWTWRLVDHNGVTTEGLGRKAETTLIGALEVAHKIAKIRNVKVLPTI